MSHRNAVPPSSAVPVHATARDRDGTSYPISGFVHPDFDGVRSAFVRNFELGEETGAAVCVYRDGAPVVDLWGGWADRERRSEWSRDTTVNMMSVAKGFVATAVAMLVDRGELDYDAPVARYWPEFAANGKRDLALRHVLDHRAGLAVLRPSLPAGSLYDWEAMTRALAAMAPLWPPGERAGYHILTMGTLAGELIRRVTGQMPGDFVRREISAPLELDYQLGLRDEEMDRVADFMPATEGTIFKTDGLDDDRLLKHAWAELPEGEDFNSADWRRAQVPGASGHGNARAVARFYACLAAGGTLDGTTLLSERAIDAMATEQHNLVEQVMERSYHQGLGVLLNSPPISPMGPNPRAFGHHGVGGSVGLCDRDAGIGFAYSMNRMHERVDNGPRAGRLKDATFEAVS